MIDINTVYIHTLQYNQVLRLMIHVHLYDRNLHIDNRYIYPYIAVL